MDIKFFDNRNTIILILMLFTIYFLELKKYIIL
jgi:hypothetical protein